MAGLLAPDGYNLQANYKTREGSSRPDLDAQFHYLNAQVATFQQRGQPAVSVEANKKELVGALKNAGREWRPRRNPTQVRVHYFVLPEQGKAIPYEVYGLHRNEGWVGSGSTTTRPPRR